MLLPEGDSVLLHLKFRVRISRLCLLVVAATGRVRYQPCGQR